MKRNKVFDCAIIISAVLLIVMISGCAQTPKNQVDAAYQEAAITLNTGTTLYTTGVIKVDDYQSIVDSVKAARDAINAWDAARVSGASDVDQLKSAALAALASVKTTVENKQGK